MLLWYIKYGLVKLYSHISSVGTRVEAARNALMQFHYFHINFQLPQ